MKRYELNRMFNALTPAPEREKALLEELLQSDTRRERSVKNWKRITVCVAVAALLTACTVGAAAVAAFFNAEKVEVKKVSSDGVFRLSTENTITYVPVDSLADGIKALDGKGEEGNPIQNHTYFDSWEDVEEFVGLDLMNNPVLDTYAAEIPYSELDVRFFDSRFVTMTDRDLHSIYVHGGYQTGDVSVRLSYHIYTDRSLEVEERMRGVYHWYDMSTQWDEGAEIEEETYTAPNGLEATIVKVSFPNGDRDDNCVATVSLNGIITTISTSSPNGVEEARKALIKVIDGFTP